jgi:hypothetical protein
LIDAVSDAVAELRFRNAHPGLGHDLFGNVLITDVSQAAVTLGEGAIIQFEGGIFIVHKGKFVNSRGCTIVMQNGSAKTSCPAA